VGRGDAVDTCKASNTVPCSPPIGGTGARRHRTSVWGRETVHQAAPTHSRRRLGMVSPPGASTLLPRAPGPPLHLDSLAPARCAGLNLFQARSLS